MTPLKKIEDGILAGNWQLVCDGFNKLTNKNLEPPKPPAPIKKDPKTKKEFYEALVEMGVNPAPIKEYTLADLQEMHAVYSSIETIVEQDISPQQQSTKSPISSGPLYVFKPEKVLHMDKHVPIKVIPDKELELVVESKESNRIKRQPPRKVTAQCSRCATTFNTLGEFTFNDNGLIRGICDVCKESR